MSIDRTTWPNEDRNTTPGMRDAIRVEAQCLETDRAVAAQFFFVTDGGRTFNRDTGLAAPASSMRFRLPEGANRIRVEFEGAIECDTAITLTFDDL